MPKPSAQAKSRAAAARRKKSKKKSPPVFSILVGVVILLGVVATVLTRGGGTGPKFTDARVTVTGDALPKLPDTGSDPAIGMTAPEVSGKSFKGDSVAITRDGRAKAIIFLAHWCSHCQAEVPKVQQWLNEHGAPKNVDMYSVVTGIDASRPNYPPDKWLEREGWTIPVIVDDQAGSAQNIYGLPGFPFFVFVDGSGKVVFRVSGEFPIEQLQATLDRLGSAS